MARKLANASSGDSPSNTDSSDDAEATDRSLFKTKGGLLNRRSYVKLGLVAAAATAGASPSISAGPAAEREGIVFSQVLDAVDDLGMDPTGSVPVASQIKELPADTLVQFPTGEYLIDERIDLRNLGNVGFEAVGEARLVGAAGFTGTSWNVQESNAVYYAGFIHDQRAGAVGHFWRIREQVEIHDIEVEGRGGEWGVEWQVDMTEPDGVGRIVNYVNRQGSSWAAYSGSGGRIGFYHDSTHEGTMQYINCDLREYGNNALYTSRCPGNVQVFDSYFENNNVAGVRIGGDGSFIENSTFVVSEDRYDGPRVEEDGSFFMRGVLIEENHSAKGQKAAGAVIRGCEFVFEDNPTAAAAIVVWSNGRSLAVEDTNIVYNNAGESVIRREDYSNKGSHPGGDPPRWLRMDNVTISGSGDVPVALDIEDADGTEIRNTSIEMTDNEADGIWIQNSTDCLIEDTNIVVPGDATVFDNSDVETYSLMHTTNPFSEEDFTYENAEGVHTDLPFELVLEHVEPGARVTFELEVDGELEAGEWPHGPAIDGNTASGGIGPEYGLDNVYFSGEVTRFVGENLSHIKLLIADAQTREVIREVDPAAFPEVEQLPRTIEISGSGDSATYEFTVSEALADSTSSEYIAEDNISGTTAEGTVESLTHAYRFAGELSSFVNDGDLDILVDGEPFDVEDVDDQLPHSIEIIGSGEPATYEFTVSEAIEDSTDSEYDAQNNISGRTAEGTVESTPHEYRFAGEITNFVNDGDLDILVNGEPFDVDDVVDQLPHSVEIIGSGEPATYEITVSEALEDSTDSEYDAKNNLSGTTAEGTVESTPHEYRFAGEITHLETTGDIEVLVDGKPYDGVEILDSRISFDGSSSELATFYRFRVSGTVEADPDETTPHDSGWDALEDTVTEDEVIGSVHYGVDTYRFSGDLVDLEVQGSAKVRFDLE